ncbi:MAG: alpha/beta hydrolase [Brevinematia bacterium]
MRFFLLTTMIFGSRNLLFSEEEKFLKWRKGFDSSKQEEVREEYLKTYGLDFPSTLHKFYYLPYNDKEKFFVHEMIPEKSVAIIIFFHGYLSHSGIFKDFYEWFLKLGYHIVAVDLPGHGLSDGTRTGIDDFDTYATMVYNTYVNITNLNLPAYFVGHSTGCSAILEFIHKYKIYPSKVVFVAPLVRIILWNLASFGYSLLSNNIREIPRLRRETSRNPSYIDFIFNKDPLKYEMADVSWFGAVYRWNQKIANYPVIEKKEFLIIQGNEDEVVDWRYNIEFLKKKLAFCNVVFIDKGKHDLLTEIDYVREFIFATIENFLY